MRCVIYTAVFGCYDDLKQPAVQDIDCDFFCFSDCAQNNSSGVWQIVTLPNLKSVHPRMLAKYYKIMSHKVFPSGRLADKFGTAKVSGGPYQASIWIDASIEIVSSKFAREAIEFAQTERWAMFRHPSRDCIFEEAVVSARMEKYAGQDVKGQVDAYRDLGFPEHAGLFACGVIARREPLTKGLKSVNWKWWLENRKWTYQDQLSLPFVLRKSGVGVGVIEGNLWINPWLRHHSHNRKN